MASSAHERPATRDELRAEIGAFYREHNASKMHALDDIVNEAVALDLPLAEMMRMLRRKYGVASPTRTTRWPREVVNEPRDTQQRAARPAADEAPSSGTTAFGKMLHQGKGGTEARDKTEEMFREQARQWILAVLADCAGDTPQYAAVKEAPYLFDALRDGIILVWLERKLRNPSLTTLPRLRSIGVHRNDNVSAFMQAAKELCGLGRAEVFDSVDLVEGKNDRTVLSCLLAMGRWALHNGRVAPAVARMEQEIDEQERNVDEAAVDAAIAEATAAEESRASSPRTSAMAHADSDSDDEPAAAHDPRKAEEDREVETLGRQLASTLSSSPRHDDVPAPAAPAPVVHHRPVSPPTTTRITAPAERPVDPGASPKRYRSNKHDNVDRRVGRVFNSLIAHAERSGRAVNCRIARTRKSGEYVIFHKYTGKRQVVYVRELNDLLMIRVGGGWEDFGNFLARRMVDYEVYRPGTVAELERQQRRRSNTHTMR